jgi:hypothetical protein
MDGFYVAKFKKLANGVKSVEAATTEAEEQEIKQQQKQKKQKENAKKKAQKKKAKELKKRTHEESQPKKEAIVEVKEDKKRELKA